MAAARALSRSISKAISQGHGMASLAAGRGLVSRGDGILSRSVSDADGLISSRSISKAISQGRGMASLAAGRGLVSRGGGILSRSVSDADSLISGRGMASAAAGRGMRGVGGEIWLPRRLFCNRNGNMGWKGWCRFSCLYCQVCWIFVKRGVNSAVAQYDAFNDLLHTWWKRGQTLYVFVWSGLWIYYHIGLSPGDYYDYVIMHHKEGAETTKQLLEKYRQDKKEPGKVDAGKDAELGKNDADAGKVDADAGKVDADADAGKVDADADAGKVDADAEPGKNDAEAGKVDADADAGKVDADAEPGKNDAEAGKVDADAGKVDAGKVDGKGCRCWQE